MKKYIIASIALLLLVSFLVTQLTFAQTTTATSATSTKVIKKHVVKPVVRKQTKQNTYSACVGKEVSALAKEMRQKKINAWKEYQKALKEINEWYKNAVKEAKEKCKTTTTPVTPATSTEATTATTSTTTP
jgi:uncharacterized protein YecT (DUF1311 family)